MTDRPYIAYMTTNGLGNAWVGNELGVVTEAGIPVRLFTLRREALRYFRSAWARRLHEDTRAVYPIRLARLPLAALLGPLRFGRRFFQALGNAMFGRREHTRARLAGIVHFFVALDWASDLRTDPPAYIHSQWIHSCGTVAMYGAWLLGVPYGFTGHATDLFRDRCALKDKVRRASLIACISSFHRALYVREGARPAQLEMAYCGIDIEQFAPPTEPSTEAKAGCLRIRSSGRLVEKKGFDDLIEACGLLVGAGLQLEGVIAGSGPLRESLQARIDALALSDRIRLTGEALKQEDIAAFMHGGDVYCLPCKPAPDGDIDGLPQMLMEAMACGLPAVSTRLVGIPDLIEDGESGLLVEHGRPHELAAALARLAQDPELASRLAAGGRRRVLERFEITAALRPLINRYRAILGTALADASQAPAPTPAEHIEAELQPAGRG